MTLSSFEKEVQRVAPASAEAAPSTKTALGYSFGTLGRSTIGFVVSNWLLYFYLPPEGSPLVPIALYGIAIILGRLSGAFLAPLIGYASDNAQFRWGRRLPFMAIAGLPLALLFVLLWSPPFPHESYWNLVYLTVVFGLFRGGMALYQVPYESLLPEIASSDQQRVKISAWQSGFLLIGMLVGGVAGGAIEQLGFGGMALIYGAFGLLAFYVPFLVVREHPERKIATEKRIDFRHSLAITLKNRAFTLFALAWAMYMMTTSLVQSSAPFIVTQVCHLNKSDTILFYIPGLVASLASYPLVTRLTKRWGKSKVFPALFLLSAVIFPGTLFIGNWLPVSLKAQCVSWSVLQAVPIAGLVVLTSAFVAEITDYDQKATGQRREGMYFASMNVLEQLATGLAALMLPVLLLLGRSQFEPQGPLGVRLAGVVGGGFMLVGFLIFLRYPKRLNRAEADTVGEVTRNTNPHSTD